MGGWSAWPTADGCDYLLSDWALASDDGAVYASGTRRRKRWNWARESVSVMLLSTPAM